MSLTELLHRNHPTVTYYIFTYNLKITLFYVKCVFDNSLKEKTLLVCVSVPNSQEKHPQKFLSTSNLISIIDITEDFLCAHTLGKLTWDHFCNGNHLLLGGTIDLMRLKVSSRVHSFPHRANAIKLFPGFCVCVFSSFFSDGQGDVLKRGGDVSRVCITATHRLHSTVPPVCLLSA